MRDRIAGAVPAPLRRPMARAGESLLYRLRARAGPCVVNHRGVKLVVDDQLPQIVRKAIFAGWYEGGELGSLRGRLRSDDVVMEMGTGLGFIVVWCARRVGAAHVHTFEADVRLQPLILRNCQANNLYPNLHFALLGDGAGQGEFFVQSDYWNNSTVPADPAARPVLVERRDLKQEIRRINPSILVVDIEGGEAQVMDHIDFHNIRAVSIELHPQVIGPERSDRVRAKLSAAGFATRWTSRGTETQMLVERG